VIWSILFADFCYTKRCVLEQILLLTLTAYSKSYARKLIDTKINDLDICLEVVWGHGNRCITFAIE